MSTSRADWTVVRTLHSGFNNTIHVGSAAFRPPIHFHKKKKNKEAGCSKWNNRETAAEEVELEHTQARTHEKSLRAGLVKRRRREFLAHGTLQLSSGGGGCHLTFSLFHSRGRRRSAQREREGGGRGPAKHCGAHERGGNVGTFSSRS